MKGVGRNPKDGSKKKGGLKVCMLTGIHADSPQFVKISEAKMHDRNFLWYLHLPKGSMVVFDKAYNDYLQFAGWTQAGVNFVDRLKDNSRYEVQGEALFKKDLGKDEFGVYKVEHIHVKYAETIEINIEGKKKAKKVKQQKTLCLRLVFYKDEQGRKYGLITNNWEITDKEVALIYKYRLNGRCFEKGGRFLKTENQICNFLFTNNIKMKVDKILF